MKVWSDDTAASARGALRRRFYLADRTNDSLARLRCYDTVTVQTAQTNALAANNTSLPTVVPSEALSSSSSASPTPSSKSPITLWLDTTSGQIRSRLRVERFFPRHDAVRLISMNGPRPSNPWFDLLPGSGCSPARDGCVCPEKPRRDRSRNR
jgi:hypothetical protein